MLDKRCTHKIRELQLFYLFRKHGYFYYAFYPQKNVTRSTGELDIRKAYVKAYDLLGSLGSKNVILYRPFDNKKRQRDLNRILALIDQTKPLTSSIIKSIQKQLLNDGLSGKSINNYIYNLKNSYTGDFPEWQTVTYESVYRSCFPINRFYGFYKKCKDRLHYLAFIAMTTGARAGELDKMEPVTVDGKQYLQINGTKTKNAVRRIPVIPETIDALKYLKNGFRSASFKESVIEAGRLCGFDNNYIEENHIVFHSFRKMYKTLLESCNVNNNWTEYFMGHSQTRTVNQLYFIGSSADDTEIYPKVIEALRRYL